MIKLKSISTFLVAVLLLASCNPPKEEGADSPKEIETLNPEEAGFNRDSLARIDEMVTKYVDKGFIPGAVVLIARHGKIVYESAVGWNSIDGQTSVGTNDQFRIASMTKPMVSTAIMQLYEQGKLDLQDPLSKYIPEFANPQVLTNFNAGDTTWEGRPAKREVTVHQLLTHTSGIPYGFTHPWFGAMYAKAGVPDGANYLDMALEEKMAILGEMPLLFEPGEEWFYGLSTDVLGRVVEVASGQELDVFVRENITEPLGMADTDFFFADSSQRLVSLYVPLGDTAIMEMKHTEGAPFSPDFPFRGAKKYLSGGSGLSSTARDYFVFCQTILDGGKWGDVRILNETTVSAMTANQIDTISFGGNKFGYGFAVQMNDGEDGRQRRIGRLSWSGIFHTTFWIDPNRDVIAIMMSQVFSNPNKGQIDVGFETLVNGALIDEEL